MIEIDKYKLQVQHMNKYNKRSNLSLFVSPSLCSTWIDAINYQIFHCLSNKETERVAKYIIVQYKPRDWPIHFYVILSETLATAYGQPCLLRLLCYYENRLLDSGTNFVQDCMGGGGGFFKIAGCFVSNCFFFVYFKKLAGIKI